MHEISIAAEKLFSLFNWLPVTNTLLTAWVVMGILSLVVVVGLRKVEDVPKSGMQNFMELFIEGLHSVMESILGSAKQAKEFFAVVATIFIFVLCSNWFGLIPGVGSIGLFEKETSAVSEQTVDETATVAPAEKPATGSATAAATTETAPSEKFIPLFRASSSDLSFTLAIAIWAVIYVQYIGFKHLKLNYLKKFFNFKNPILAFVGILELISEFAKMISFSFRLFGNVFAGEVLLVVMTFLVPFIIPIPFYGLEIFVGAVQAGVFAALTLVFLKGATSHH